MPDNLHQPSLQEMLERDPAYAALVRSIAANPRPWLTIRESAAYLRRSVRQVRRYQAKGEMPPRKKIGRTWHYARTDIVRMKANLDREAQAQVRPMSHIGPHAEEKPGSTQEAPAKRHLP